MFGNKLEVIVSRKSISKNWNLFKSNLHDTVQQNTVITVAKRSSKKPWITGSILKLVRGKRALWRNYKRSGSEESYKAHRTVKNQVSTVIIKKTKIAYESRIADSKNTKRLFKHIRTKLSGPVATIQIRDNSGTLTDDSSK